MVGGFEFDAVEQSRTRTLCSIHTDGRPSARGRAQRAAALLLCVATILVHPALGFAAVVTRGPYVQMGTPTGMTIRWRTDRPDPGRVLYGTAAGALTGVADQGAPTTDHE